uniref:Ovule protein n=1 Tax=Meloidogyne incognita TaxID=6306 RepID=A0A914LZ02_MELIC
MFVQFIKLKISNISVNTVTHALNKPWFNLYFQFRFKTISQGIHSCLNCSVIRGSKKEFEVMYVRVPR